MLRLIDRGLVFVCIGAMQIESLKVFCDLVESQSFTKAAQINGVTQSAVSQTISALERHFECLLIERSKKLFRLTREGEVLYDYSKKLVGAFESFRHELEGVKGIVSGTIRLSAIYSIGLHDLPPYIQKFLKQYPTVNVKVEYRRPDQVYEDVLSGGVDVGLVAYPAPNSRLQIVPLRKDPMVVICHPQHALASQKSINLKALQGQSMVSFEPNIPTRRALDKLFRQQGVEVEHAMEFGNVETVKRAVEIGAGIAIVPRVTVKEEVAKGTLAAVNIEGGDVSRPLAMIYRKNKVLSPSMKQLIALLKLPA